MKICKIAVQNNNLQKNCSGYQFSKIWKMNRHVKFQKNIQKGDLQNLRTKSKSTICKKLLRTTICKKVDWGDNLHESCQGQQIFNFKQKWSATEIYKMMHQKIKLHLSQITLWESRRINNWRGLAHCPVFKRNFRIWQHFAHYFLRNVLMFTINVSTLNQDQKQKRQGNWCSTMVPVPTCARR